MSTDTRPRQACAGACPIPGVATGRRHGMRTALAALLLSLAACQPATPDAPAQSPAGGTVEHGAADPVQAVLVPTALLRANDYAGFARATTPAELHTVLEAAWRNGQTRWPLDELPFDERLPALIEAFARDGAEQTLQKTFDRQFAGAERELHTTARALGVFGTEYLRTGEGFSTAERAHYTQLVQAASEWARRAPLGDKRRAHAAVVRMAVAARGSGLGEPERFAELGMEASLRRITPFLAAAKKTVADYGLDLDAALDAMQVEVVEQDGDAAVLRMRYPLGERRIDARVHAVQVDGRWYLQDFLEHARAAAALALPPPTAPAEPAGDADEAPTEQPPPALEPGTASA